MAKNSKISLLNNLSTARKARQEEFSKSMGAFRAELKPDKLLDRASRSASKKAAVAGDKITDAARSHPGAALAIGSALLGAILFKPVKSLITGLDDDSEPAED